MKKSTLTLFSCILLLQFNFLSFYSESQTIIEKDYDFSFVFLTDIHLQPERNAVQGFTQAIDRINNLNPDFVITGGDLIMDALDVSYDRADSLYTLYSEIIKHFNMPVYNTLGNHEIFGIYRNTGPDTANPEYGEKMFEHRIGKSYYSFDYDGTKFMILNSVEDTQNGKYIGIVDQNQMDWIMKDLGKTDPNTPIVISTHIPFITAYAQKYEGSTIPNDSTLVVANSYDVLRLYEGYNLKLVLQGHLHTVEDIYIDGINFITGGAICGKWWKGANRGYEEGFLYITCRQGQFDWEYVDYGWEVEN
ncbi:metallophosphoesterase family protein [candidate division KSB1 bacterium]